MRNRTATPLIPIAAVLLLLPLTGCDRPGQGTPGATASPPPAAGPATTAPAPSGTEPGPRSAPTVSLAERAATNWKARQGEDWETLYDFQIARVKEAYSAEEFEQWSMEEEPILVQSFELGDTIVDGDLGWVEIDSMVGMRRFPDLPARPVHRWDKWRVEDGKWFPVPTIELGNYPASPAERDAAEEARLRERFETAAWPARRDIDFAGLYELMDPHKRPEQMGPVPKDETEVLHKYLRFKIIWVEVVGNRGKVRVKYEVKKTDPSLMKLPPEVKILTDRWVKVDGEWYLNVEGPTE